MSRFLCIPLKLAIAIHRASLVFMGGQTGDNTKAPLCKRVNFFGTQEYMYECIYCIEIGLKFSTYFLGSVVFLILHKHYQYFNVKAAVARSTVLRKTESSVLPPVSWCFCLGIRMNETGIKMVSVSPSCVKSHAEY